MDFSYDGRNYYGWMKQSTKNSSLKTIESTLEDTLRPLLYQNLRFFPSGRTDSKVSANHQVAVFFLMTESEPKTKPNEIITRIYQNECAKLVLLSELKKHFNQRLPNEIQIKSLRVVEKKFDPMKCSQKTYSYTVKQDQFEELYKFLSFCAEQNGFHTKSKHLSLDLNKMKNAGEILVGIHDFKSFQSKNGRKSTVREILKVEILENENELKMLFTGKGFLYNQVRIMVGTLFFVGAGFIDDIRLVLEKKNRNFAGPKMWPENLFLEEIKY
eukprot:snap_masked-scaffold_24-processed-gene-4.8-mRNA-1 protein AED:1.00 eAED:1.00 QI:0/-1/0/0/-1/1/1/0/270